MKPSKTCSDDDKCCWICYIKTYNGEGSPVAMHGISTSSPGFIVISGFGCRIIVGGEGTERKHQHIE